MLRRLNEWFTSVKQIQWKLNDSVSPEQIPKSDVCGGIKDKKEAKEQLFWFKTCSWIMLYLSTLVDTGYFWSYSFLLAEGLCFLNSWFTFFKFGSTRDLLRLTQELLRKSTVRIVVWCRPVCYLTTVLPVIPAPCIFRMQM